MSDGARSDQARRQHEFVRSLFTELRRRGLTRVIVSPGSRSTPLVFAARDAGLTLHSVIDERCAAFVALGLARATDDLAAMICTSGTAVTHAFPAVVEASATGLPLMLISADRPLELQGRGAPQTIDQRELFGSYVRFRGTGDPADTACSAMELAQRGCLAALDPVAGGPIHLNVRLRKPLEPHRVDPDIASIDAPSTVRPSIENRSSDGVRRAADAIESALETSKRPLMVAGPNRTSATVAATSFWNLADAIGAPAFAESTSQWRHGCRRSALAIDVHDAVLRWASRTELQPPDLVIQWGHSPIASGWRDLLLDRWKLISSFVSVAPSGLHDPWHRVTATHHASPAEVVLELERRNTSASVERDRDWIAAWSSASDRARSAVDEICSDWNELAAIRSIVENSSDAALAVSNSLPVRVVDVVSMHGTRGGAVLHQRGAAGIDGLISAATGSSLKSPVRLICGDVAFLHDVGGLAAASTLAEDLVIFVIDNGGGRLFDVLPIAEREDLRAAYREFFLTAPRISVADACRTFSLPYARATSADNIATALRDRSSTSLVVEIAVHGSQTSSLLQLLPERIDAP